MRWRQGSYIWEIPKLIELVQWICKDVIKDRSWFFVFHNSQWIYISISSLEVRKLFKVMSKQYIAANIKPPEQTMGDMASPQKSFPRFHRRIITSPLQFTYKTFGPVKLDHQRPNQAYSEVRQDFKGEGARTWTHAKSWQGSSLFKCSNILVSI